MMLLAQSPMLLALELQLPLELQAANKLQVASLCPFIGHQMIQLAAGSIVVRLLSALRISRNFSPPSSRLELLFFHQTTFKWRNTKLIY